MKTGIADLVEAGAERATKPLTYYHELDDTYYTATSKTFIGSIYALAGLQNIADAADKDGSGLPAALGRVHRPAEPRPDLPGRHQVLQAVAVDRRRPPGLERPSPR